MSANLLKLKMYSIANIKKTRQLILVYCTEIQNCYLFRHNIKVNDRIQIEGNLSTPDSLYSDSLLYLT